MNIWDHTHYRNSSGQVALATATVLTKDRYHTMMYVYRHQRVTRIISLGHWDTGTHMWQGMHALRGDKLSHNIRIAASSLGYPSLLMRKIILRALGRTARRLTWSVTTRQYVI
jgi:hypothetical protein